MSRRALIAIATLLLAASARAHDGAIGAGELARSWTFNLWVLATLSLAALVYLRGARAQRQLCHGEPPRRLEDTAFTLALLTLVVALLSPLDRLSDLSFAAHMAQHELLMLLAAPLLVLSRPLPTYLRALPTPLRARVAALLRLPSLVQTFRFLSAPLIAVLLHGVIRWIWHLPSWFQAALDDEWVHGVQHATFFLSACLFWWGLVQGRYGRGGYGLSFLFVLLTAMHTGALGALLSFSERLWYPHYAVRTPALQLDPVVDQQVAGLVMWVGAGVWMMLLALALFLAWLGECRRRAARGQVAALTRGQAQGAASR